MIIRPTGWLLFRSAGRGRSVVPQMHPPLERRTAREYFGVIDEIVDYSRCGGSTEFRRRNSALQL